LRVLACLELDFVQLAQAFYEFCDRRAEFFRDLCGGDRRVFYDIVQQSRDDGLHVEMQRGEDASNRNRVGDIRVAGMASLAFVRDAAELDSGADVFDILRLKVGGNFLDKSLCVCHALLVFVGTIKPCRDSGFLCRLCLR
jgi:hypothetical protein